jgi:hypothetical protein
MIVGRYQFETAAALDLDMSVTISMQVREWRQLAGQLREARAHLYSAPLHDLLFLVENIVSEQTRAFTTRMESAAYYSGKQP